jgi:hypothetical protein
MRNRLALSLFAGCAALLSAAGVTAQAPASGVQAIPASTPEAPRDADGNLMTGNPFIPCGPTTGSQIGILPNSVRNTSAQNAAARPRRAAAGADAVIGGQGPRRCACRSRGRRSRRRPPTPHHY